MGSACCTAAKDKDLASSTGRAIVHGNVRCSPTWSLHWDNRRRVAGEIGNCPYQMSNETGSMETKGALASDGSILLGGGSPHESFGTPVSKSPVREDMDSSLMPQPSDALMDKDFPLEVKNSVESPDMADSSATKLSYSANSSSSTPTADPLCPPCHPLPPNITPSRRVRLSPGTQLYRQISDSQILGLKSANNCSESVGRSSFVHSTCSHDLAIGSHGSSDGWSMRTFSELVASSQRERWSFDSEHLGFGFGKISECSSRFSYSPSKDLQTCGACLKFLTERSSWISTEVSVISVLVCGHVYHADCLETMTQEVDRYDPACPICVGGEKQVLKMSKKAWRTEAELKSKSYKISRNRIVDSSIDSDSDDSCHQRNAAQGEFLKVGPSTSRASSSIKPFLRRHFSFGSKWSKSLSWNDTARKEGLWSRYLKDRGL